MHLPGASALLVASLGLLTTTNAFQVPFNAEAYDSQLFTPLESLSHLSTSEYTALSHPLFPNYGVRIKKTEGWCDPDVNGYTGYIDIQARHLFFYFFESRNDPAKDDVIFWTNGGPGCSSSLGLLMELGPCTLSSPNATKPNPHSWNSNANIFFVDQPIGVGFSYADYGESVGSTPEAAQDIAAFVAIFFSHFSSFQGRAFHMAGESYGGRYVPLFAAAVYDQNALLEKAGLPKINLQSVMIGNGITDFYTMVESYHTMTCTGASVDPIADIASCIRMKQAIPRCKKWLKKSCIDSYDSINCGAAYTFCDSELATPFWLAQRNPYDISRSCTPEELDSSLCYPVIQNIASYLSLSYVRDTLGVDPSVPVNFSSCSPDVGVAFAISQDELQPGTKDYIEALLHRGVKALIYAGNLDWICNWVGNEAWTAEMSRNGTELRSWEVDGKKAGLTRSDGMLTFVNVEGAGHMVPYDKPREAAVLVERWLKGEDI